MQAFYEAQALVTSLDGGLGHLRSDDGVIDLKVSDPPESAGEMEVTNPEQLFAAAFASCFEGALRFVAGRHKLVIRNSSIQSIVQIGFQPSHQFRLSVHLKVNLPDFTALQSRELIEEAGRVWPFAQAEQAGLEMKVHLEPEPSRYSG